MVGFVLELDQFGVEIAAAVECDLLQAPQVPAGEQAVTRTRDDDPDGYSRRYRVYPNAPQRRALAKTFGCARVVYNGAIANGAIAARQAAHRDGLPVPDGG